MPMRSLGDKPPQTQYNLTNSMIYYYCYYCYDDYFSCSGVHWTQGEALTRALCSVTTRSSGDGAFLQAPAPVSTCCCRSWLGFLLGPLLGPSGTPMWPPHVACASSQQGGQVPRASVSRKRVRKKLYFLWSHMGPLPPHCLGQGGHCEPPGFERRDTHSS